MQTITLHQLGSYALRNYVLGTPQGYIAIDTGYPGGGGRFIQRFEKIAPIAALRYIFLTHAHDDHAGFLGDLLGACDARVILSPLAVPVLKSGENAVPPGSGYSTRLASTFGLFKKDFSFPPVSLGERGLYVTAENQFFHGLGLPLRILFLPGHTADSIGLLDETTGSLFCGDAAMNAVISRKKHTIWMDDARAFGASWDVMAAAEPTRIYPAHGNPFSPALLKKHRHFMDGRALIPMKEG